MAARILLSTTTSLIYRYITGHLGFSKSVTIATDQIADEPWLDFHDRLLAGCSDVWRLVEPVLCIDSPEGQYDDDDDDGKNLDIGIKDTLSYCWRALKESR